MNEESYFDLCIIKVRQIKKDCKKIYPFIRWTNKIVLWAVKVHQSYISPSKKTHIKDGTFKYIYTQLNKITPDKLMKKMYKLSK